jgi:ATP-binding cassette, subfamily B, bacterial
MTARMPRLPLRGLRATGRLAWRADRPRSIAVLVSIPVEVVAFVGFGLAIRHFFDAAVDEESRAAVAAAGVIALTYSLLMTVRQVQGNLVQHIDAEAGVLVDAEIIGITSGQPGLEHLERPEYLDRVNRVRGQGAWIVDSFWSTLLAAGQAVRLGAVAVLLAAVHPALLFIVGAAAAPVLLQRVGERRVRRAMLAAAEDSRLAEHLMRLRLDPVTAREVMVTGAAPMLEGLSVAARHAAARREWRAQWAGGLIALAGWAVFLAAYVGGLAVIAELVLRRSHSLGELIMVLTLSIQLKTQIEGLLFTLSLSQRGAHVLNSYLWLLDVVRCESPGTAAPPDVLRQGIALHGVGFTYPGTGTEVLSDLDLELRPGSLVAVVGEHGSGKTTLVKLLSGFYPPTRGMVTVDGVDLRSIDLRAWQQRTVAAYQRFVRFELTMRSSVEIGDVVRMVAEEEIWRALDDADAAGIARSLPDGLDTRVGRHFGATDLSTGQWQRVALARACVRRDPLLVVLDEPTASLDPVSEQAVFARQVDVARRSSITTDPVVLLVTHRFSTVVMADVILVLQDGRIVERGDHETLLRADGAYAALFRLQQRAAGQLRPGAPRSASSPASSRRRASVTRTLPLVVNGGCQPAPASPTTRAGSTRSKQGALQAPAQRGQRTGAPPSRRVSTTTCADSARPGATAPRVRLDRQTAPNTATSVTAGRTRTAWARRACCGCPASERRPSNGLGPAHPRLAGEAPASSRTALRTPRTTWSISASVIAGYIGRVMLRLDSASVTGSSATSSARCAAWRWTGGSKWTEAPTSAARSAATAPSRSTGGSARTTNIW